MENPAKTGEIKDRLMKEGLSITDLASVLDKSRTFVSLVINGHKKSKPIASYIEDILGAKKGSLFSYLNDNHSDSE